MGLAPRALVLIGALLSAACGSDSPPVAPSPPPPVNLAGQWSGTMESNYTPEAIALTLNQVSGTLTGTWAMTSGIGALGNVTGTVDATNFTGTMTYNYPGGPTCAASVFGVVAGVTNTMTWTSPGFTTGSCGLSSPGNPVSVRWVLQRR